MISNLGEFRTTVIDPKYKYDSATLYTDIASYVTTMFRRYRDDRRIMENHWTVAWASYLNTPESNAFMRANILREVGNVRAEWRHRINTGKAFEVVETVVGYLIQAIFPSDNWFEADPASEEYTMLAKVVRNYLRIKMKDWNFRSEATAFIRQAAITGNSVMMMPWSDRRYIQYETLDMYDCFFNPRESHTERSPFIRRIALTRADVIERLNSGFYSQHVTPLDVMRLMPMFTNGSFTHEVEYDLQAQRINQFQGINIAPCSMTDKVYVFEYWGDVHLPYITIKNCVITTLHGHLLRFVPNNYKCGRPFVIASYMPVVRQTYGMSATQSASGMMHLMNTTVNQLADGIELAINPMYTVTPDSTLNPNDIYTEPGKMLGVNSHDSIRPMAPPLNNFNLGYNQINVLENFVNQNTGTGPLIGTAQPRGGERVTAAEINQVIEAGGNRLLTVYTHLSDTAIAPILRKSFQLVQQFTNIDEDVLMEIGGGQRGFVTVGKPELMGKYKLYPLGAEHVVQRTEFTQRLISILELAGNLPDEVRGLINIPEIFKDIIRNTLYEDPERYIITQEAAPEQPQVTDITDRTISANLEADGGANLFRRALGYEPTSTELPIQLQQQLAGANPAAGQLPAGAAPGQLPPA